MTDRFPTYPQWSGATAECDHHPTHSENTTGPVEDRRSGLNIQRSFLLPKANRSVQTCTTNQGMYKTEVVSIDRFFLFRSQ